jgi:hypothetical protein
MLLEKHRNGIKPTDVYCSEVYKRLREQNVKAKMEEVRCGARRVIAFQTDNMGLVTNAVLDAIPVSVDTANGDWGLRLYLIKPVGPSEPRDQ